MQGRRQVSAGEAGLRCGGGGGPETLALRSEGEGRGPGASAAGWVVSRPGAPRRENGWVPAGGVRAGKVGRRGTPAGQAGRSPGQSLRLGPGGSDWRPPYARLPGETGTAGVCERGRPEVSGRGARAMRRCRGFSVRWGPWGPRELGVAPAGERWEVGRPRAAGSEVTGEEAPSRVRTLPRRAAVGGGRVCGLETLN